MNNSLAAFAFASTYPVISQLLRIIKGAALLGVLVAPAQANNI